MTDITGADIQLDEQRLELLRRRIAERGLARPAVTANTLAGVAAEEHPEMSDGQRRMWFVQSVDPDSALLNVCVSYRATGAIDLVRLRRAVDAVAARHTVLRTTYQTDNSGDPQPVTHHDLRPGWTEHDLSGLPEQARRLRLEVLAQREFGRPFDLATDAPLRITVVRVAAGELILLLTAHHIAWDDGSWAPFFTDLTRAYANPEAVAATPASATVPREPAGARLTEDLAYWRSLVTDLPEPLELPGSNGSVVPTTWRSQRVTTRLSAGTVDRATALAREVGATPYMVLMAAFGALVHRYTHATEFLIAAPVLNRGPGTEDVIGFFGNTVVIRMRPRPHQTFRELVAETRDSAVGAFAHSRADLEWLVREFNPDRRHGAERMTRVSFGLREPDGGGFCPPGVECERAELRGHFNQLPLGLMIELTGTAGRLGDALVEAEYLVEVLDRPLVEQLLEHYTVLLDSMLAGPDTALSDCALMSDDDVVWLRQVSAGETFATPQATLPALVAERAALTPDAVAVVYEGRQFSYREINQEANRLAHWLIEQGIGTEDRVAVLLDKSPELVTTALGIVKAGAVYLPIDPTYPDDRLAFILGDADAKLVLREPVTGLVDYPTADPATDEMVRPLRPDNTAYLIYTSGSTGLPKGVPVPHAPITEYFVWFGEEYRVDETDRLLQVASPSFDVSMGEIFGTLICGARLVIPRPDGLRDIGYLTDLLSREGITSMHFVPSLLGLFLSLPGVNQWRTLRRVPIGGEALPGEIADKFHATFDALLYNFYGPTETVVNATSYPVEGSQGTRVVPIGRPKINTQVHLLDDALRPVPVGVIGEIYIGGTHVAHGYHRRLALTAERFIADPFTPGGRLYRSGDLARRNADGDIEFVGRADEQVKIRGFRIELGEVAAAISVDPSVGQAVVVATDLPQLGKSLVGYVTANGPDTVDLERIRARVAAALPEYMTPAAYVVLDEIPITAHGKIDRAALPQPQIATRTQYRDPTTPSERRISALFSTLLGHDRVGADDSFFDLGGHSLVATKLVTAIRAECGVELGIRDVFELGTVARLADRVDQLRSGDFAPSRPKLIATTHDEPLPLSASQLRSWFAFRIEGPAPVNNIPFAARMTGPLDVDALISAAGDVVARHEILRTTYVEIDGVPYQVVNPVAELPVRRAAWDGCADGGVAWLKEQLDVERRHCFELDRDWPIRVAVLRTGDEYVLSVVVHHIASDHWSGGVLFADLMAAYRARRAGEAPSWAPLRVQYADYAAWQRAFLGDAPADESAIALAQKEYWDHQLVGLPEDTGLRPDFPRPPVPSGEGESVEFHIDSATRDKLTALSRELGITEFMLLQAAVAVVLHKAGGGVDIPLGTPVAGRSEAELEHLVGFFVNILVLRNDLSGNPTLREVLTGAREMALAAYAHQDLPFDRVVDSVSPMRSLARNPLFQVVVHARDQLPAVRVIDSAVDGSAQDTVCSALAPTFDMAQADLSINFFGTDGSGDAGYAGNIIFRTELYRTSTIERLADWLTQVVNEFASNVDQTLRDVQLIDAVEHQHVLDDWSRGAEPPPGRLRTIPELLEPSRQLGPDRIAVWCGGEQINYPALHRRSDNMAALLATRGVGPGSLVGLSMRRGIDLVAALMGIMKAGAGYFPIDPGYPLARKQFMLDDVEPRVVIVTAEAVETMPKVTGITLLSLDDPEVRTAVETSDGADAPSRQLLPHPDDPMYLVFTSGSTGKPKGVLGTHRGMAARLDWQLQFYPPRAEDTRLAQASITFLEGPMELLAGLAAGATMILADDAEHRDPEALGALMRRHSVAQVTAVPSLVSALLDSRPDALRALSRLVCGGEPVSASLLQRLVAACADSDAEGPELLNNIGSTETSGAVVRGRLHPPTPRVGKPVAGADAYLLDDALRPVPVGVVGELYYAGDQLARGYWKRPGLTASRFVANPFATEPGARLYRSGDLARWTGDGQLEFAGRIDHQVQVRGFRVELAEVEAALLAADGVAAAAARSWEVHGSTTLAGYIVPQHLIADEAEKAAFAGSVRVAVAEMLPGYMLPSSLTVLDKLPKTESGKLNRPGLPQPTVSTGGEIEPPRTETERTLAAVFVELLSTSAVGRFDDFFTLGGDSILSVQLAARARAAGLAVSPRMVFENPTVQLLAAALDARGEDASPVEEDEPTDTRFEPMSTSGLSSADLAAATRLWSTSRDGT